MKQQREQEGAVLEAGLEAEHEVPEVDLEVQEVSGEALMAGDGAPDAGLHLRREGLEEHLEVHGSSSEVEK